MSTNAIAYALTTCPQFVTFTGRNAEWEDTHIPRTDRPVRFHPATRVPFGLCWGMVNKWAVTPSRIA